MTPHFSFKELTTTSTTLPNIPSDFVLVRLRNLAENLEIVRALLGHPMHINSAYRSESVNRAVGGSATSSHCDGDAADFICPQYGTPKQICMAIVDSGLRFDQLILEPTWVHIGFGKRMRQQVMTKLKNRYVPGLHGDENGA